MNIVITGAGRGIGLELTRLLLKGGHRVFATRRDAAGAAALTSLMLEHMDQLSVHALEVTSLKSCQQFAEELGDIAIDVLINNAGVLDTYDSNIDSLDFESFTKVMDVNTLGPLRVMQSLMAPLRRAKGNGTVPKVLNISSKMGSIATAGSGAHAYRVSKAALNKAVAVIGQELKAEGICVLTAHPGWVRTDMGGSNADIDVTTSATGLIKLLDKSLEDSGGFFNYSGETLPW